MWRIRLVYHPVTEILSEKEREREREIARKIRIKVKIYHKRERDWQRERTGYRQNGKVSVEIFVIKDLSRGLDILIPLITLACKDVSFWLLAGVKIYIFPKKQTAGFQFPLPRRPRKSLPPPSPFDFYRCIISEFCLVIC